MSYFEDMYFDEEDEGWMWLPWEDIQAAQKVKNEVMRQLLDGAALACSPIRWNPNKSAMEPYRPIDDLAAKK